MKKIFYFFFRIDRISFYVCLFVSIFFLVFLFFSLQNFIIDKSVIIACSELWAFAALAVAIYGVHKGTDVHVKRGETEVTLDVPNEKEKENLD